MVGVGNIDFEGEYSHHTNGSNLIRSPLLDNDPRPLYIQAWGGLNTIARALLSIQEQYSNTSTWPQLKADVSRKAIIMASSFQDETYTEYIAPSWPAVRVEDLEAGYATIGYNCICTGQGNIRGDNIAGDHIHFTGAWIHANTRPGRTVTSTALDSTGNTCQVIPKTASGT